MLMKADIETNGFYTPRENCWTVANAQKASLRIDCANYFKSLYHALTHARHSIFILGWDIDSRIELLRGEDSPTGKGITLYEVINDMARKNPDLKIYLNKWNYSLFFAREREPFCGFKWHFTTPKNVYFCSDYNIQFTGCHHQKVIVVDDEIAFCGGMDIALGRWDKRQHHVDVEERVDPGGLLTPFKKRPYGPYHDIMIMMYGPVVKPLAQLVRTRWQKGAGFDPIPVREGFDYSDLWPQDVEPQFSNTELAIARTVPRSYHHEGIDEVAKLYIDEILQAEKFIYIENQYLTYLPIAQAINKRLREKPALRVLAVSSDHPRGLMEHKSQWTGRVLFCETAAAGIESGRFVVTYPISREKEITKTVHIHSKLMIVDDKFLHIGSSNLNNRSMGFDTECDISVHALNIHDNARISAIRNNLIREHTGRKEQDIQDIIQNDGPLMVLLEYQENSRQHLIQIDNEPYKNEKLAKIGMMIGDPKRAHLLLTLPVRQIVMSIFLVLAGAVLAWNTMGPAFFDLFSADTVTNVIENAKSSPWGLLAVIGIYILGGFVFFPLTVLNLTTAIAFGPLYGLIYALAGSLSSAAVTYWAGRFIGKKLFRIFGGIIEKIQRYITKAGIIGMTLLRLVPIAPFTLVNVTFGISKVSFWAYMIATLLGLLPGVTAKALFGGAVGELWHNPEPQTIAIAVVGLALWVGIIVASQKLGRRLKPKESNA